MEKGNVMNCWLPRMACLGLLLFSGCSELNLFRLQNADKDKEEEKNDRSKETVKVGDYATVSGNTWIAVHGVGFVTGLNNTGEDPAPSVYRTQLETEMKKRGITNSKQQLESPTTALVLLTAYLPVDIRKGDSFDVEVRLPPNTEATSLAGGWLLPAELTEQANIQGQGTLKGKIFGRCQGPILVSIGKGENQDGVLKRGRILGGGRALKERSLGLNLRSEFQSVRNTSRIATKIGARFHFHDHGQKKSLAEAKNDQYVLLKVHPRYKENYPRYLNVVKNIAFRENDLQRRDRMERLQDDLLNPEKSALAAIQYEAIGTESVPFLKKGLNDPSPEVRLYSAEALAYLANESGAAELAKLAKEEPAFRVYCVAALAALDEAVCYQLLRDLMDEPSAETKYGAFRAMWTMDKDDPFIRGAFLNDHFYLHVIDTKGEPMIHLTRHKRPEIVLFGTEQKFRLPLALTAGNFINVNAQAGAEAITLTRFEVGKPDQRRVVSPRVADVILAAADMGATYPDIAQLVTQAASQYNVEGRVELDALPQAGRRYYRSAGGEKGDKKKGTKIGRPATNPNLFPTLNGMGETPEDLDESESGETPSESGSTPPVEAEIAAKDSGTASLKDIRKNKKSARKAEPEEDAEPSDEELPPSKETAKETAKSKDSPPPQSAPPSQGGKKSWLSFNLFGKKKSVDPETDGDSTSPATDAAPVKGDGAPAKSDGKGPPTQGEGANFQIE
ncbi:MAG: flagellar P-ring protein [Planctomycetaceae bacterium]|nr:flagellar P-ring protein [Planctomycetaceae bacterium]